LLGKTMRAAGRIEPDERRTFAVTAKFEGYVERLHVNATGQPVAKGQPLFEAYSPELVSAQREYAIAMQGLEAMKDAGTEAQAGMRQLADSSLARLRNWDLSAPQVTALMKSGQPQRTISFPSPVTGIVSEKKALQGMRFMPGELLYQVTDLSSVWVIADVSEQDIALVKTGAKARVTTTAYPTEGLRRTRHVHLPHLEGRDTQHPGACRDGQPGPASQAGDVCPGGTGCRRQVAGADGAGLGRDRPARGGSCWSRWGKGASSRARSTLGARARTTSRS
jgi:multidrug efflux pump subunit AcrA (membrane-fusion protein)